MVAQTFGPSDVRASAYEPLASRARFASFTGVIGFALDKIIE